jgi:hypothetical protein
MLRDGNITGCARSSTKCGPFRITLHENNSHRVNFRRLLKSRDILSRRLGPKRGEFGTKPDRFRTKLDSFGIKLFRYGTKLFRFEPL